MQEFRVKLPSREPINIYKRRVALVSNIIVNVTVTSGSSYMMLAYIRTSFLCCIVLLHGFYVRITTSQTTTDLTVMSNFSNLPAECFNPLTETIYKPEYKYCIYGIKYYRNSSGFDTVLYFNDANYPWHQNDITHDEFEKAARPLCDDLTFFAKTDASYNALYYAAWVRTVQQTHEDIFILCCKPCPVLTTVVQWRITLKLHFLIRRQYSLMKNYKMKEVLNDTDGTTSYIDEGYYITNRMPEASDRVKTCTAKNFRRPDDECVVWMTYDEYGYECCCYGNFIGSCQERMSSSVLVGVGELTYYDEVMLCAINERINSTLTYSYDSVTNKVTLRGKMRDILSEMRTKSYCPLYLEIANNQRKFYLSATDLEAGRSGSNIHPGELAADCHNFANWDYRLLDIVRIKCIQLVPLTDMCPFSPPTTTNQFEALCCCNYRTFCNYNGPILNKLNATTDQYCKYNFQYQFLFNGLYLIEKPPTRSCILHYIDNSTLQDMDERLPQKGSILFQQPGSAFSPIDYSYALLKDGDCRYIDVQVNHNYTNARFCNEASMFKTTYLPLKVFACRCRTEVGAKKPCDEELEGRIEQLANLWPVEKLTRCIRYDRQNFRDINFQKVQRVYSTHTSFCYTEISLEMTEDSVEFYATGDVAKREVVNKVEKYLDHIAYSMWIASGTRSSLCEFSREGRTAYCFCRSSENDSDACNAELREMLRMQRMLMYREFLFQTRIEYRNTLADHLEIRGRDWCHFPGAYATLEIDMKSEDVVTRGACIRDRMPEMQEFDDYDRMLCDEIEALQDQCVVRVTETGNFARNHLLCCCKDDCEMIGFTLQTTAKNIEDQIDAYEAEEL